MMSIVVGRVMMMLVVMLVMVLVLIMMNVTTMRIIMIMTLYKGQRQEKTIRLRRGQEVHGKDVKRSKVFFCTFVLDWKKKTM